MTISFHRRAGLAAGLALAALAGPALAQDPGLTKDTIKIGAFATLSGPNMAYGFDAMNAARMYYDKINKEGGIHGRKIEVVLEDDRCSANDLVAAVKKLVEQEKVFLLNGGNCSAAVVAATEYIVRNKVPYAMLNASGDGALYPPNDYIFGAFSISQYAVGGSVVEFAASALKAKKIGYINHDDAYGSWNLTAAKVDAAANNTELIVESVAPNITDMTAPFLKLRAANPDVIVILTYARPAALLIKKAHEMGFTKPIVLSATGTANLGQLVENAGGKPALKNLYFQDIMVDLPGGPKLKWVYDMYKASYPELAAKPDHPQAYMPYGLPSAMAVVTALKAAGPDLTREKFLAEMKKVDIDTGVMAGRIKFSETNRAGHQSAVYIKYDGDTKTMMPGIYTTRWVYKP